MSEVHRSSHTEKIQSFAILFITSRREINATTNSSDLLSEASFLLQILNYYNNYGFNFRLLLMAPHESILLALTCQ